MIRKLAAILLAALMGAAPCAALAEDVVRGKAAVNDCTVLVRRRMEAVLKALGKGE